MLTRRSYKHPVKRIFMDCSWQPGGFNKNTSGKWQENSSSVFKNHFPPVLDRHTQVDAFRAASIAISHTEAAETKAFRSRSTVRSLLTAGRRDCAGHPLLPKARRACPAEIPPLFPTYPLEEPISPCVTPAMASSSVLLVLALCRSTLSESRNTRNMGAAIRGSSLIVCTVKGSRSCSRAVRLRVR